MNAKEWIGTVLLIAGFFLAVTYYVLGKSLISLILPRARVGPAPKPATLPGPPLVISFPPQSVVGFQAPETETFSALETATPQPSPPTQSAASIVGAGTAILQGQTVQIVPSTQSVQVTGTNLPPQQTLQAAAQITGTPVISSTSVSALGGLQAIQAAAQLTYTPLGTDGNVASTPDTTFTYAGSDGFFYTKNIIGYNNDGSAIYAYTKLGSVSFQAGTFFTYADLQAVLQKFGSLLAYRRYQFGP